MDEIRSMLGLPSASAPIATVHKRSREERDADGDDVGMADANPHYQMPDADKNVRGYDGQDSDMPLARGRGRGRGRGGGGTRGGRGRKSTGTAAERARAEHETYVERIYPRMPPYMKPRYVRIDPDNITPMKIPVNPDESFKNVDFITTGDGLHEVSFGCSSHVPFVADGGAGDDQPLRPEDHPYVETVNYKSYGYRDATTAILLARGQGSAVCKIFAKPL